MLLGRHNVWCLGDYNSMCSRLFAERLSRIVVTWLFCFYAEWKLYHVVLLL